MPPKHTIQFTVFAIKTYTRADIKQKVHSAINSVSFIRIVDDLSFQVIVDIWAGMDDLVPKAEEIRINLSQAFETKAIDGRVLRTHSVLHLQEDRPAANNGDLAKAIAAKAGEILSIAGALHLASHQGGASLDGAAIIRTHAADILGHAAVYEANNADMPRFIYKVGMVVHVDSPGKDWHNKVGEIKKIDGNDLDIEFDKIGRVTLDKDQGGITGVLLLEDVHLPDSGPHTSNPGHIH